MIVPDDLATDEDRHRAAVGAEDVVIDVGPVRERCTGRFMPASYEQRGLGKPLGDGRLAREPRIVAGTGRAEFRDEHGVAVQHDAHGEVGVMLADDLDRDRAERDGVVVVERLLVEGSTASRSATVKTGRSDMSVRHFQGR